MGGRRKCFTSQTSCDLPHVSSVSAALLSQPCSFLRARTCTWLPSSPTYCTRQRTRLELGRAFTPLLLTRELPENVRYGEMSATLPSGRPITLLAKPSRQMLAAWKGIMRTKAKYEPPHPPSLPSSAAPRSLPPLCGTKRRKDEWLRDGEQRPSLLLQTDVLS